MTILWIRLLPDRSDHVSWCTSDDDNAAPQTCPLDDMPWQQWSTEAPPEVRVIVPGEKVLSLPVALPPGKPEVLHKALPYAIEDHIVDEEGLWHCAPASALPDGRLVAWVVDRQWLMQLLERVPYPVAAVLPDYACIAAGCCVVESNRRLVSLGHGLGASLPATTWSHWRHAMQIAEPALYSLLEDEIEGQNGLASMLLPAQVPGNLLQGDFAPPSAQQVWDYWRWPILTSFLVLLCVSIWFAGLGWYYQSASTKTLAATQARAKELFPKLTAITALKKQVQKELEPLDLYQQTGVLLIYDRFVQALQKLPEGKLPEVQSLRFDTGKKRIQAYLTLASIDHLDILLKALREQGLRPVVEGVSDIEGQSQITLMVDW